MHYSNLTMCLLRDHVNPGILLEIVSRDDASPNRTVYFIEVRS